MQVKSFAENFLVAKGFNTQWIESPDITAEKYRMDICVKDNKYAIIFENKVKGAGYQPNQIARYIQKLTNFSDKQYGKDNIFIVLMPNYRDDDYVRHMPESVWRLPSDPKHERRCVVNQCRCDHDKADWDKPCDAEFCKTCNKTFKRDYEPHTIVLQSELSEWLMNDCAKSVPAKEIIIKSFIIQLADFLNLQYGTRENQKLKLEMEKYLTQIGH